MPKRIKGIREVGAKFEPIVTTRLQYRDFVKHYPDTCISYKLYQEVQENYFKLIGLYILTKFIDYTLPNGLGSIGVRVVKQKPRKRIDYNETRKAKEWLLSKGVKEEELRNSKNPEGEYHYIVLRESGDYAQMFWDKTDASNKHRNIKAYDWNQRAKESSPKYNIQLWKAARKFKDMMILKLRFNPQDMYKYPAYKLKNEI